MNKLESSLVSWINSNDLSYHCHSIEDLSDGILLYELMGQISSDHFQSQISEDSYSTASKAHNLNKLISGLETFYYEELGKNFSSLLNNIDTSEIAQNNDRSQLISLLEMVMGAVIKCKDKETYIARIVSQNEAVQSELMTFIEKVLSKLDKFAHNEDKDLRTELTVLRQEKRALTLKLEDSAKEVEDLKYKNEDLRLVKDRLIFKINELEVELDKKQSKKENPDTSLLKMQLNQKETTIRELRNQINDITKKHQDEIVKLKDELDMAQERDIQLNKAEATLELYKKKLEELSQFKTKAKDLEEERDLLKDKIAKYEENVHDVCGLQQTLSYYKEQFSAEKDKNAALLILADEKENALKNFQKLLSESEAKRNFLDAKNKELNDEIEQLKFKAEASIDDLHVASKGLQSELEERINSLVEENSKLKLQVGNQRVLQEMNEQMDQAFLFKKKAEENLQIERKLTRKTTQQMEIMSNQIESLKEEITKLEEDSQAAEITIKNLKSNIENLEKEKNELLYTKSELEKLKVEKESHSSEMKCLFREKEEIIHKLMQCKEEVHALENQLRHSEMTLKSAQIDLEQAQNRVSIAQEREKFALSQLEFIKKNENSEGARKAEVLEMEKEIMNANKKIAEFLLEIKEKDNLIWSLQTEKSILEEELRNSFSQVEEICSQRLKDKTLALQEMVNQKDLEIRLLVKDKKESEAAYDTELKLMSTIMFEIGNEIFKGRANNNK
ncbi:hk_2 [Blepharisma stoltei]|uniref:Calponin-homology (CH) domain-containing protein n=1 Tax=Blepharisma stoltei TaxID=1481888 RepID=A0AAU9JS75_9CILI|nr:unnamed protein product [Blepharisma stoltei]